MRVGAWRCGWRSACRLFKLCQCDGFKAQFDEFSKAQDVLTIPCEYEIYTYSSFNLPLYAAFYFNFKGSIYGKIQASMTSGSRTIPKKNFLATLLLPCGKLDAKVKKFTGNDDIGDALDNMTKAIHAFAHWSLLYSRGHILFCDLQGIFLNHDRNWNSSRFETEMFNRCARR